MGKAVSKAKGLERYVGKCVCIRTVTYHYTGKVVSVTGGFVWLTKAAWISDSGRWHQALKDGTWLEVEPYVEDVGVAIPAIVDVTGIREAPTVQK